MNVEPKSRPDDPLSVMEDMAKDLHIIAIAAVLTAITILAFYIMPTGE